MLNQPSENSAFRVPRQDHSLLLRTISSLRRTILSQHFRPGDRLVERELCELTGVSRGSVREALRHLEVEGLVRTEPYHGLVVASLDRKGAEEIYQIRMRLDPLVARLCVERANDEQIKGIERASNAFAKAVRTKDCPGVVDELAEFYGRLFEASENRTAAAISRTFHVRLSSLRTLSFYRQSQADADKSIAFNAEIVRCIKQRDADAAAKACADQVERSRRVALKIFDQFS